MAGEPVVFGLEVKGADVVAQAYRQVTAEVTKAADAEAKAAAASKSVTAAATAQAEAVKEAGRQSAVTTTAARAVAPAAEAAAVGMKSAAAAGQNLRFQLADVFTSLAGGMNPLMVLAQQGPQIAEAFGGAAKSADVLKAALGPAAGLGGVVLALAPAVLAAGGAFLYLNAQLKEAEATAKAASDAATKAQGAYDRLRESQRVQTVQAAVLAGQFGEGAIGTTEAQIAAERQFGEVRTQAAAKVAQSEARLLELRKQVQTASAGAQNSDNAITIAKANTEIRKKTEELGRNRDALGEVDRQIANTAASIVEWTERVKTSTSTVRAAVPVLEVYAAAVDGLYPVGLAQSGADLIRQINAIAPAAKTAADTVRELEASIGAINLAKLTGKIGADVADGLIFQVESKLGDLEMKGLTAALSDSFVSSAAAAMQKLQADADRMAAEYQRRIEDRTQRIGQGASSLMSGDLTGALGAAVGRSPTGAAVMAGVQGLGALGAQGADATAKQIEATAMGVVKGLKQLGPLIGQLIPMLAVEIPVALVKAVPQIAAGLITGLLGAAADLGKKLWEAITFGDAIRQWWDGMGGWAGIRDALRDWWRGVWDAIKDFFTRTDEEKANARQRRRDTALEVVTLGVANTDTYNPGAYQSRNARTAPEYRPQAAMFASPAPSGGGAAGGGFGSSTVHVHMPPGLMVGTADEVVRKLSQHLGTGGRRLTLPPGSVRG